jgi:hypothetical protein
MNSKLIFPIMLVLFLLVFSGCIKLNIDMHVKETGKGSIDMLIDLTQLAVVAQSMSEETEAPQDERYLKDNICQNLDFMNSSSGTDSPLSKILEKDSECTGIKDNVAKLSWKNVDFEKEGLLSITGTDTKEYNLVIPGSEKTSQTPAAIDSAQAKSMGVEMLLTVHMPGEIVSSTYGKISNDKKSVAIDMLESGAQENGITIVSKLSQGFAIDLPIIAISAIIVLIVLFLFLKRK